ncbi:unnamed protein product [Caenorhabditis auriculariae]|uniref:Uncharacterized protein n=1 Tax=Caenorhabditis auriculariae TaxID=2777116 RepID=A0A8S1HBC5_9PELO|nr:unnamed protein product [Caenorhabditis auriculariae]
MYKRTILITGSTDGIGRQTALDLAAHPDNFVVLHGRSAEKCEATREFITRENGNKTNVDYVVADLSVMKEVASMAQEVEQRFPGLNILLCNAGVLNPRRVETADGLELTLQVNYFSHFLLCNLLLEAMVANNGCIVVVGSVLHTWASILEWGLTLTLFCKTPEGVVQRIEVWQMGLGPLLRQLGCVCWSTVFLEHPVTSIEVLLSPGEKCLLQNLRNVDFLVDFYFLIDKYQWCFAISRHCSENHHTSGVRGLMNGPSVAKSFIRRLSKYSMILRVELSLDWSDLMAEKDYEKYLQYSRSKLMCHLFVYALHRRMNISGKSLTVNIVELGKEQEPNNNGKLRTTSALSSSMSLLSICRQAVNLAQLLESPLLTKVSGKYLDPNGKQMRGGSDAMDEPGQNNFFVSTICYEWHSLNLDDVEAKEDYEKYVQYSRTKLMNFMVGLKLAREAPPGITVNNLEPGVIETKLLRNGGFSGAPVREGSVASIHCVMSLDLDSINGGYFDHKGKKVNKLFADATDVKQQNRVWEISEELCKKHGIEF